MDLEREFAAWVDGHDPDALTRVFDATAGRLLLLAVHVAGAEAAAADLVQATFVTAMARGSTWDRARPLWPWLAAILQNEARMQWRKQKRRREVALAEAQGAVAPQPDPGQLAASDDAFAAVVATIDALPLPYRQVLRLRLVHGLEPIEIARALEAPVGTVRARLHRGLAQLRQALPAGIAGFACVWFAADGSLAQVRARVAAEAAAAAAAARSALVPTAAATMAPARLLVAGGWWIMHGKTVGLVAAAIGLLLVLGLALVAPLNSAAGERRTAPPLAAVELPVAELRPAAQPDLASVRRDVSAAEPAWPLVVTVTTAAGEPLAGVSVRVTVAPRGLAIENGGDGMREDLAGGTSGADGTFRCTLDAVRSRSALFRGTSLVFVAATSVNGEDRETLVALPRSTEPREFTAELVFGAAACAVVGQVVDARGAPVAGARLLWLADGRPATDLRARSRSDGRFHIGWSPRWGNGRIAATDAVHGVGVAALPQIGPATPRDPLRDVGTIVLDGTDAIRGQVVLGDGSGLGGFSLFVQAIDAEVANDAAALRRAFEDRSPELELLRERDGRLVQSRLQGVTAVDGSFVCSGLDPDRVYAVAVRDTRLQMIAGVARVGGDPLRLVVERQLLSVEVRGEGGELLRGTSLTAEGFDPAATLVAERVQPGFPDKRPVVVARWFPMDAAGRHLLLSPFGWVWRLGSSDEIAAPTVVRHDALAGVHRAQRTIELRPETRFGSLHLVVVDEHNTPYPDYGFDLRSLERDLQRNHRRLIPPADGMWRDLPAGRWRLTVELGKDQPSYFGYPRARGEQEHDIVIEEGRTTAVKIVSEPLGRVGFRLRADAPLRTIAGLRFRMEPSGAELAFDGIVVETRGGPGGAKPPLFLTKHGLAPGKQWFVVSADGYQPVRCAADVVADQIVCIDVALARR